MELFLNVLWLMLALPAVWLWHHVPARLGNRRVGAGRTLLLLGCVLVLLFPVVSATDDLHAMRQEMEESTLSKRTVRPAAEKVQSWQSSSGGSPAQMVSPISFGPSLMVSEKVLATSGALPGQIKRHARPTRAPPSVSSLS